MGTHICRAEHYRTFVLRGGKVPRGAFPEDTLGQAFLAELKAAGQDGWREVHARYGTYLYLDGGPAIVGHLKGRKFQDEATLREKGWRGWGLDVGLRQGCVGRARAASEGRMFPKPPKASLPRRWHSTPPPERW